MNDYINDFPILKTNVNGKPLVYLDNAATTQKPASVIDAVSKYYQNYNANPHRGLYNLSVKATEAYENARVAVKDFIGAESENEIIFTRGTTESINLIAYSYGMNFIHEGDEIVVAISEHHSNIVPWQQVARSKKAVLKFLYLNENGIYTEEEIDNKISEKTKLVAIAQVSNVLGIVNPVEYITRKAHEAGAVVVVDCAQSVPHFKLNVKKIDVDFVVFSGHKMLAPMGIGVLYGKASLLDKMPPFMTGGDMIEYVYEQKSTFAPLAAKFEAGTQNVGGAVGLNAAIDYINKIGFDKIQSIEEPLLKYALNEIYKIENIDIYGDKNNINRCGIISFNVKDVHPHDVASILDSDNIAIRAGHHCAQPLMRYLGINHTCRMSLYFYNTKEDIDIFADSLKNVRRWLGYGS